MTGTALRCRICERTQPLSPRSICPICNGPLDVEYSIERLALTYARTSIRLASRRATRVLTVSESSKRDILRFVDVAADKIDVIYNAYDERFGVEPREEDVIRVRERYQLHDEFVLYAGNVKPHKNLERLIDAFDLVRKRGGVALRRRFIGHSGRGYRPRST